LRRIRMRNDAALGHVEKDGAKYRLVPAAWNPVI
jgi:hypothetical protein